MLGPEQARLEVLEERAVDAASVGNVLPEAVARATNDREEELAIALEPTVTRAVAVVARRRPELYGEILAPTIGAAVRKAVAEAIAVMLERFNEALERSLSVRSLRWRMEAARTGRPFAEVVLLRTLRYRVEQILLIHTETSLVLEHLVDPMTPAPPSDQVAAMFSAIDAFGREAFGPLPPEAHLRKFELGDLTVWVVRDAAVTIAAVVRGTPAVEISQLMTEAAARLRLELQPELAAFQGDVSRFAAAGAPSAARARGRGEPPPFSCPRSHSGSFGSTCIARRRLRGAPPTCSSSARSLGWSS